MTPYDADVAIVATKAYDTEGAIETLRRAVLHPEKCVFVTPQNGVGNEEMLAAAFGANNVVAAALTVPVDRDPSGNANAAREGGLAFAPVGDSAFNWLVATFASSGMNVKVVDDWRALKWSKLALNVVANASCAILNVLPNRLVHFEKIFTLEIRMIREVKAVMQAMAIVTDRSPALPGEGALRRGKSSEPDRAARHGDVAWQAVAARNRRRCFWIYAQGKPQTEVDVLNGAVARAGTRMQRPDAGQRGVRAGVDDIANMPQLWAKYRERPEALVAEVEAEMRRIKALRSGAEGSCATLTFRSPSKAGGFSTVCSVSTGARGMRSRRSGGSNIPDMRAIFSNI